jgi:hypothetical protein
MTRRPIRITRSSVVVQLERQLREDSYPRLQMGLIVALTGAFGLLASFALLRSGIGSMALRYPLALGCAYLFFLFLLWLWLRTQAEDYVDLADAVDLPFPGGGGGARGPGFSTGRGGDFGGGGAQAGFDGPAPSSGALPQVGAPRMVASAGEGPGGSAAEGSWGPSGSSGSGGSSFDLDVDAGELIIPLLVALLAVGLALASLYVVWMAPGLLAELLFDGALSYSLYRHLRHEDHGHWLQTAVRRTALPFALTAVFVALVGAGLSHWAPGARTLGQALGHEVRSR